MINPAIETDLVGELAHFDVYIDGQWKTNGAGRIRAVTADRNGSMCIWLEVMSREDAQLCCGYGYHDVAIGDVLSMWVSPEPSCRLRLIRSKA